MPHASYPSSCVVSTRDIFAAWLVHAIFVLPSLYRGCKFPSIKSTAQDHKYAIPKTETLDMLAPFTSYHRSICRCGQMDVLCWETLETKSATSNVATLTSSLQCLQCR
eukprot:6488115-Amphidinium_carterae.1